MSVDKNADYQDYNETSPENLSFDLSMSRVKKRRRRCYEEIRIIRPNYTRIKQSSEIKAGLSHRCQTDYQSGSPELRPSFDTSPETATKQITRQKITVRSLISQFRPFGRYPSMNKSNKETEFINIHTPNKETSLHRPTTPKNWSFRAGMHTRRPVSSSHNQK